MFAILQKQAVSERRCSQDHSEATRLAVGRRYNQTLHLLTVAETRSITVTLVLCTMDDGVRHNPEARVTILRDEGSAYILMEFPRYMALVGVGIHASHLESERRG